MTINASALPARPFSETPDGAARFWLNGLLWRLLATGPKTGGALCLLDEVVGAQAGGPVTHTHPQEEGLYLIEGRCTFFAGGQTVSAGPGTFVAVPRHAEHAFMAEPGAHFINFYLPAGFELIVAGLGAPAERNEPPSPDQFAAPPRALVDKLAADYGQTSVHGTPFVDPPLLENMATAPLPGARAQPFAAHADTAKSYWRNDILWSVLADGDTTDSGYTLMEQLCPAGSGAPPHAHLYADEAFYMLEGEAEFVAGNVREVARAGGLVFIPKGVAHAFRVRSKTARMLNLYTQPGFERLLELTGVPAASKALPPRDLRPPDVSAARREQLFVDIGMQQVALADPLK